MSLILRKPVFRGFRPGLTQTRMYSYWRWLEAGNFIFRKQRNCTSCVAKTKTLISFAVTAKVICVFVFAYAKRWFSHVLAHMNRIMRKPAICICKNKDADQLRSWAVPFFFATKIVQPLFFLDPKFPASSHLLMLYHPVGQSWGPSLKSLRQVYLHCGIHMSFFNAADMCLCCWHNAKSRTSFHLAQLGKVNSIYKTLKVTYLPWILITSFLGLFLWINNLQYTTIFKYLLKSSIL